MDEPAGVRLGRGKLLHEAVREDLDLFSLEDLAERIEVLSGEIARCRAAAAKKSASRAAAEALFAFRPDLD